MYKNVKKIKKTIDKQNFVKYNENRNLKKGGLVNMSMLMFEKVILNKLNNKKCLCDKA